MNLDFFVLWSDSSKKIAINKYTLYYYLLFFSWRDIRRIAFEVIHGLSFLNKHGIVHRNLTPGNISLAPKVKLKILCKG